MTVLRLGRGPFLAGWRRDDAPGRCSVPDLRLAGASPRRVPSASRQDPPEAESPARGTGAADDSVACLIVLGILEHRSLQSGDATYGLNGYGAPGRQQNACLLLACS